MHSRFLWVAAATVLAQALSKENFRIARYPGVLIWAVGLLSITPRP
jgi:hypothetical protein